ncbi:MAG: hypothetical protein WC656_04930 [Sulfurimonas sp.]|jgi:hypothetical protein
MKNLLLSLVFIAISSSILSADVYVRGYTKSNGTYVEDHYRSSPNSIVEDNYSYKGSGSLSNSSNDSGSLRNSSNSNSGFENYRTSNVSTNTGFGLNNPSY